MVFITNLAHGNVFRRNERHRGIKFKKKTVVSQGYFSMTSNTTCRYLFRKKMITLVRVRANICGKFVRAPCSCDKLLKAIEVPKIGFPAAS